MTRLGGLRGLAEVIAKTKEKKFKVKGRTL
jgi:hypothetical protein